MRKRDDSINLELKEMSYDLQVSTVTNRLLAVAVNTGMYISVEQ